MENQNFMGQEETPAITPTPDEKTMGILSHILCIVGGFIAPLIIYLIKKDESVYIREQAKESLNFQLTMLICYIVSWILIFVVIGLLLVFVVIICNLVFIIIATIKASEGKLYRYPINFRFIK
ncbi:MAG: DUF4870 domain-containing protein [Bacteroidota bacterium]